jgi:hypothetical protein
MSIGPPALGNILVQRLDAVLGTSMAAYANLINGARPDAVAPPGEAERSGQAQLDENGQVVDAEGGAAKQIADAKAAATLALAARGLVTSSDFTPSAPTTLGQTARTILALLAQYPDKAPASAGRAPLWTPAGSQAGETDSTDSETHVQADAVPADTPTGQAPASRAGSPPAATGAAQSAAPQASASQAEGAETAGQAQAEVAAPGIQARAVQAEPTASDSPARATRSAAATRLASTGQPQPAQFIQALRAALQQTGLFYESHLTQMAFGQRAPAQLASEPQARLDQNAVITRDTPIANTAGQAAPPAQSPSWGSAAGLAPASHGVSGSLVNTTSGVGANRSTTLTLSGAFAADNTNPLTGIHPDATLLVRQQLDVLADQAVVWQGQAWPGVDMEWEIERDHSQGGGEADDTHWATRLQIELPRLGLVQARLNLAGNQLVMHLVAPASSAELSHNSDALRERLASAGLALSQISVDALPPQPFDVEPL